MKINIIQDLYKMQYKNYMALSISAENIEKTKYPLIIKGLKKLGKEGSYLHTHTHTHTHTHKYYI
jgi:hypothetical protein